MDTLKSNIHYYLLDQGFINNELNIYTLRNIRVEYDDFYTKFFKYYIDDKLIYLYKSGDLDLVLIKKVIRSKKIDKILNS